MLVRTAAMTLLSLVVSGITASGCYWAWRSYRGWQASADPNDTSGEGGMAIAGAGIALACFAVIVRIAFEIVR